MPRSPTRRYEVTPDLLAVLAEGGWAPPSSDWMQDSCARLASCAGAQPTDSAWLLGSGRAAMLRCLQQLDVHPPARVVVPAWTFAGVPEVLSKAGFEVVFADVAADVPLCGRDHLAPLLPGTSVLILTHLFGRMAGADTVAALCHEQGVKVVEDCAHAMGSELAGVKAGQLGDAAFFSFDVLKPLAACGGGLAVVRDGQGQREVLARDGGRRHGLAALGKALAEIAGMQVVPVWAIERARRARTPGATVPDDGKWSYLQARLANRQIASFEQRQATRMAKAARLAVMMGRDPSPWSGQGQERANGYFLVLQAKDKADLDRLRGQLRAGGIGVEQGTALADLVSGDCENAEKWRHLAIRAF